MYILFFKYLFIAFILYIYIMNKLCCTIELSLSISSIVLKLNILTYFVFILMFDFLDLILHVVTCIIFSLGIL